VVAPSNGELAAADEKEDRREPGTLRGGFILFNRAVGPGKADGICEEFGVLLNGSGSSEASVTTEPASEAVDARRFIEGLSALKEGGRDERMSMLI
jgi:hypothetical protein